jgi:hypothetical protein
MRAITMEANAILLGENKWFLRYRGSDILPPSVRKRVAIHSSVEYPDFAEPLAGSQRFPGNIVAVAKAGCLSQNG